MKSKTKVSLLLTLLIIFLSSGIFNSKFSNNFIANNNYLEFNEKNQIQIKQSGFWNLTGSVISIDDSDPNKNWTYTASHYDWCSGSGNWTDPYVIENVTINGQISSSYIEINNSDACFIIRNCSLYNLGSSSTKASINLYNVDNGKIINCICIDNDSIGIYLFESNNNTLLENTVNEGWGIGIALDECNNNTLSGNTANYNYLGIYLDESSNNTLLGNNASNNTIGIGLIYSENNTLSENLANNNYIGITFGGSKENKLSGNTVSNSKNDGIWLFSSDNNTLSGNNVSKSDIGIRLEESNNNTLSGNTINNSDNCGIFLYNSNMSTLLGNLMNFCGIYLYGSFVELASHYIDDTNLVNNKPVYYYVNEIGLESSNFTNAGQIILINCSNSIISGLNLSNGTMGISLGYSNNNMLSGNTANNNKYNGIDIYESNNNTFSGNTVNNNNYNGISLFHSEYNTVSGNIAEKNNVNGIYFYFSHNNTLSGNDANYNNQNGIELSYSNNNTFSGNTISNNLYGIYLDSQSKDNKIFLNNFIDNDINAEDNGINNKWDDGFTGNYWDDYVGVDANDDGIGDTPYLVLGTAGSHDNFPLLTVGDDIAPVIIIILPLTDSIFSLVAPNYSISINELNLDTIWYTLDGGGTNYTITSLTGTFNQTAWEALSEGSVTIRFYANDTAGNISFIDVEVVKEIPEDIPEDSVGPLISFGNYYILFMFIAILSFIILEKQKKK